ncbi:MAG: serine/threonine-protein kinase [Vicinamibacterales bacterium]
MVGWLGRGGMGEVYRAHDASLGRDVALKVLPADLADDSTRLARLRREARLLASLNHPNVAGIFAVVEDEHRLALVLELIDGPTLAERLTGGALPLSEVLTIARQIAEAVEAATQKGVVHRDLKPANIKVTPGGLVKVLDFGIAKAVSDDADGRDGALTRTGARGPIRTAAYMSPEQARGEAVDHRADVWAFGCVVYELLSGVPAFPGASFAEVIGRVLERDPDWGALPAGLPPSLGRLLRRTLEKNPRRRLGYIGDAILDIDEARAERTADAAPRPAAMPPASRRPWMPIAAAAAASAGLAIGAWLWRLPAAPPPPVVELGLPIPADQELVIGQLESWTSPATGRPWSTVRGRAPTCASSFGGLATAPRNRFQAPTAWPDTRSHPTAGRWPSAGEAICAGCRLQVASRCGSAGCRAVPSCPGASPIPS